MINFKRDKAVLCLGDANPDIVLPYGETVAINKRIEDGEQITQRQPGAEISAGGSVGNCACGCSRLSMETYFCGKAGADSFGKFLVEDFIKEGVKTDYFYLDPALSSVVVFCVIGDDKNRVLYAYPRRDASCYKLTEADLSDEIITKIDYVITSGIMLREEPAAASIIDFLKRCKAAGVIVAFDLNLRIESIGLEEKYKKDILACAESANILFGSGIDELVPLSGKATPEEAAKSFVREDRIVICRNGKYGSTVYTHTDESFCPAFDVPVVDTIGAGDSFNAGFLAAIKSGETPATANIWGNATACYNIMHKGGRNCPTRSQLLDFLKEYDGIFVK